MISKKGTEFSATVQFNADKRYVEFLFDRTGNNQRLRDAQIERLRLGQTVILKKAVSEASSAAYLTELRSMGLDALAGAKRRRRAGRSGRQRIQGGVLGTGAARLLERTAVMAAAAKRLRVGPAQLMQMFSGAKVVLKRGVSAEQGARLVVDLALIGMQIELEMEQPAVPVAAPVAAAATASPEVEDDPQYGALLRTACDLSGTAFSGYDTSSSVARDEPDALVPLPQMPAMPVRRSVEGHGGQPGRLSELPALRSPSASGGAMQQMRRGAPQRKAVKHLSQEL